MQAPDFAGNKMNGNDDEYYFFKAFHYLDQQLDAGQCWRNSLFEPAAAELDRKVLGFYAAGNCYADFMNNGLRGVFLGFYGRMIPEFVGFLRATKCERSACCLEDAVRFAFGESYPRTDEERDAALTTEKVSRLEEFSDSFDDHLSAEGFREKLLSRGKELYREFGLAVR